MLKPQTEEKYPPKIFPKNYRNLIDRTPPKKKTVEKEREPSKFHQNKPPAALTFEKIHIHHQPWGFFYGHQDTQIPVENALLTLRVHQHCQPARRVASKWREPQELDQSMEVHQPNKNPAAN